MFLNTEETYKMLQPFNMKEELNMNTKIIRENHKEELYGTVRDVLDVLHRYAIKFPGVCYLAKKQIAELLNVSTRTIVRACNKLVDLGIIVQYETKRHRGDKRQSTNAIVFLTQTKLNEKLVIAPNVIPECHTKEAPKNAPEKELKNTDNTITEMRNKELQERARKDSLLSKVPSALKGIGMFSSKVKDIYELNGTIFRAKNKVSKTVRIEDHENLFRKTIANVFEYWKRKVEEGNKDYNVFALMYKAIRDLTEKIVDGTAYTTPVAAEDKVINGITQATIDAATDVFERQRLINKRKRGQQPTRRTEMTPKWLDDNKRQWEEEAAQAANDTDYDLEAERQRVLVKLGLA